MKDLHRHTQDLQSAPPFEGKFFLYSGGPKGTREGKKHIPTNGAAVKVLTQQGWQILRFSPETFCHHKHWVRNENDGLRYLERVHDLARRKYWQGSVVRLYLVCAHAVTSMDVE